jgi:hypothetical protein
MQIQWSNMEGTRRKLLHFSPPFLPLSLLPHLSRFAPVPKHSWNPSKPLPTTIKEKKLLPKTLNSTSSQSNAWIIMRLPPLSCMTFCMRMLWGVMMLERSKTVQNQIRRKRTTDIPFRFAFAAKICLLLFIKPSSLSRAGLLPWLFVMACIGVTHPDFGREGRCVATLVC